MRTVISTLTLWGIEVEYGPLLLPAIGKGEKEFVKELLSLGANPNTISNTGMRPIHLACMRGDLELTKNLVNLGAIGYL